MEEEGQQCTRRRHNHGAHELVTGIQPPSFPARKKEERRRES